MIEPDLEIKVPWWVRHLIRMKHPELFFVSGGLGSGKSYGGTLWYLLKIFNNMNNLRSWVIAPTHTKSIDIVIPAFYSHFENLFGFKEGRDFEFVKGPPARMYLPAYRHEINFQSADRPQYMVGDSISHFYMTEAGVSPSRQPLERAQTRLRAKGAHYLQGLIEGTPEGSGHWWSDLVTHPDGWIDEWAAFKLTLWTDDNIENLGRGYIQRMMRTYAYSPAKIKAYRYGQVVPFTERLAHWEFKASKHVDLSHKIEAHASVPIILGWDFNKFPLAWIAMQRLRERTEDESRNVFTVIHESSGKSRGVLSACAEFTALFPPGKFRDTPIHIYGDASGYAGSHKNPHSDYEEIVRYMRARYSQVSLKAKRANPRVRVRLERVNAAFAADLVRIPAWCTNLIRSLDKTSLTEGTFDIEKPNGDDWTHYSDAFDYPIAQLIEDSDIIRDIKPRRHGFNVPFGA